MNNYKENITQICREIVEKAGFLFIDIIIRGNERNRVIELFVDGEKNVTADELAALSREIESRFEETNIIQDSYRLDVSTPGVDRPLKFIQQFPKHVNRNLEVDYKVDDEKKSIKGRLISVKNEELTFDVKGKETILHFNNIIMAKVLISFS